MANSQNLIPFTGADDPRRITKPKGTIHLSTHIQNLMADDAFEANILDAKVGIKEYHGAPIRAIIEVAITKAVNGDDKAREWLAKYGWGTKLELANNPDNPITMPADSQTAAAFAEFLKQQK